MNRLAKLGLIITATAGVALAASLVFMAQRISAFNERQPSAEWHVQAVQDRAFTFNGRQISITDLTPPAEASDSALPAALSSTVGKMRIRYGDQSLELSVKAPAGAFPDLGGYTEWLSLVFFAPIRQGQVDVNWRDGQGIRLALANRSTAGYDSDTWGAVRIKDWVFDIVEFLPDGTFATQRMQFRDRRGRLPALASDPNTTILPIAERSWQWQAALFAVPKLQISRFRFGTDALFGTADNPGAGLTLGATALSAMATCLGLGLLLASTVKRAPRRPAASSATAAA